MISVVGQPSSTASASALVSWRPDGWLRLNLNYGADCYFDRVDSAAWIAFTDIDYVERRNRGQYLDGSTYASGGVFGELAVLLWREVGVRLGTRLAGVSANAPGDAASGSRAIATAWLPWTATAGLEWRPHEELSLLVNLDRSFRVPNLDDLTSRQQTGPGFQFENPELRPESAVTVEAGVRLQGAVRVEAWAFRTSLFDAVSKSPREASDCPPNTPACATAWSRLQLLNTRRPAELRGVEGMMTAQLPWTVRLRGTIAYTWGEGPNPAARPADLSVPFERRVPLSRIPPVNGTGELLWGGAHGPQASAAVRWAAEQDRLAIADRSDARIPPGGTPGFAVLDLRLGYRLDERLAANVVLENLFDAAYRYHGSSVNSPGRGLVLWLTVRF